ncbi:MAG: alpha/beta hydrolase [Anaerolinea sp.]|nr:alpha/beta hydrolase [Anaerolinea sp.]
MATGSAFFDSTRGRHIFEQWWRPAAEPRAVVAICHGFAEHSGRYADVASYLNGRGYAVEGLDLRGHGLSDGTRVFVRSFNEYLNDLGRFVRNVRQRNPGSPVFLLGHSMGGGVATLFVLVRRPELAGVILSGPALQMGGPKQPLHRQLMFATMGLLPWLRLPPLPAGAVSRDPEVVRRYEEDPLVYRGGPTVGLARAGLRASKRIFRDMERFELPLLIVHGTDDRLVTTSGSEELHARAQSPDKALKLYDGLFHEVLNEPERLDVLGDIADWLDSHTPAGQE